MHPGDDQRVPIQVKHLNDGVELDVPTVRGCAIVVISK
jgi:hypothetical protein